ncbi:MAG: GtrA family protein [Candidatus Nomurabacteria bacterium]|nr:MAG: GtrA family protein [Candidatus Nomurabacteria bacterium]HRV76141.1 GtrA family protein [Candidatus Saccharimonadales bacterium]
MKNHIEKVLRKVFKKRFARFFVVGVWNTLVDLTVLTIMVKLLDVQADQTLKLILANSVSATASITSSFLLNRFFVFRDGGNPIHGKKVATFIAVSLIGAYGINNTVLNLVVLHADWLHNFTYSIVQALSLDSVFSKNFVTIFTGKAVAGLSSMLWSFWAYGKFVFKRD